LPLPPPHPHFLPPSDSHTLALLLLSSPHLPPSDIPSPHAQTPPATADSPHAQIEPAIAALLAYYRLHLPPFPPLRSLPLLLSLL
ncbi:MAG: hypothetical protein LBU08_00750, partial [Tannerellaceae bacterium]|nr:hypothetical protein [Tannerellaceae bacterium]